MRCQVVKEDNQKEEHTGYQGHVTRKASQDLRNQGEQVVNLKKIKLKHLIVVGILFYLFYVYSPVNKRQYSAADLALFTSATNLLTNGNMDVFCVKNADGKSYTDDGTNRQCSFSYDYCDSRQITSCMVMQPYGWNNYGCGMYKYYGTETPLVGNSMMLIKKETHDDWYGFQISNIPVTSGINYKAMVMAKRLLKSGDSRDCLFRILYYTSSDAELPTSNLNTVSNLGAGNGQWEKIVAVAVAPTGAVKSKIDIQCSEPGDYQYLVDGQYFGKNCQSGEIQSCSSNIGECRVGQQTCNANGVWGACTGIVPVKEVCFNNKDDDCDGSTDENCDLYQDYTLQQWKDKFNAIDSAMHNGQGSSDVVDDTTYWAWDNTPIVESYLDMYFVTKDNYYLTKIVTNLDKIKSYARDTNGDGKLEFSHGSSPIDPILEYSRILLPYVKFAYTVRRDKLTQYYSKADEYVNFVVNNFLAEYDRRWVECGSAGAWLEGTTLGQRYSAPNNRASYIGRIYTYLYLMTGNQAYKAKVERFATKYKSSFITKTDGPTSAPYYTWHYHDKTYCKTYVTDANGITTIDRQCSQACSYEEKDWCAVPVSNQWMCSGPAEAAYTGYELMFILDAYRAGIAFTATDIEYLKNSLKEGMIVTNAEVSTNKIAIPVLNQYIGVSPPSKELNVFSRTVEFPHWPVIINYDPSMKQTFFIPVIKYLVTSTMTPNPVDSGEGLYRTHPFDCVNDLRGTFGMICAGHTGDTPDRSTPAYLMSKISSYLNPIPSDPLTLVSGPQCTVKSGIDTSSNCVIEFSEWTAWIPKWLDGREGNPQLVEYGNVYWQINTACGHVPGCYT